MFYFQTFRNNSPNLHQNTFYDTRWQTANQFLCLSFLFFSFLRWSVSLSILLCLFYVVSMHCDAQYIKPAGPLKLLSRRYGCSYWSHYKIKGPNSRRAPDQREQVLPSCKEGSWHAPSLSLSHSHAKIPKCRVMHKGMHLCVCVGMHTYTMEEKCLKKRQNQVKSQVSNQKVSIFLIVLKN